METLPLNLRNGTAKEAWMVWFGAIPIRIAELVQIAELVHILPTVLSVQSLFHFFSVTIFNLHLIPLVPYYLHGYLRR